MHVIDFTPTGEAQAMHNDKFDLSFLGKQSITRATEIKFSEATQLWGIFFAAPNSGDFIWTHTAALDFKTYDGARKVEVEWLNHCRLAGVDPMSMEGRCILIVVRKDHPES